jgi:hypothetical protein
MNLNEDALPRLGAHQLHQWCQYQVIILFLPLSFEYLILVPF